MYVIDGHNLIPKIQGLSLSDIDDENQLIQLLITYCQRTRSKVTIFFDGAEYNQHGWKRSGAVTAHFVTKRSSADAAIHAFLVAHRREISNYQVVSSDRQVQTDARAFHARVISAETFSEQLLRVIAHRDSKGSGQVEEAISEEEILEWETLFNDYNN